MDYWTRIKSIILVWVESQSLDSRESQKDMQELRPNGFTEPTILTDFPIRERRMELLFKMYRVCTIFG